MTPKQKIKQIILLVFGLSVAHLGVTFFIQANLGTDPFNVLVQGIFRSVPWPAALSWTHGRTHMMICFLIIMVLLFVDPQLHTNRDDHLYVSGRTYYRSFYRPAWRLYQQFSAHGSTYHCPCGRMYHPCSWHDHRDQIGSRNRSRMDRVAIVTSDKSHRPFGIVRILTDCFFVIAGFLLGGTFGLGTIICAFIVGPVAYLYAIFPTLLQKNNRKLKPYPAAMFFTAAGYGFLKQ